MLAYIITQLPITSSYSPIPNTEALLDALGCNSNYNNESVIRKYRNSQDAIDNIITFIPVTDCVVERLLIYTQSSKVMEYICSWYTITDLYYIVSRLLHTGCPNRYVVTYLNTKMYEELSQINELTAIYPDLYNTSLHKCIGYQCFDDIAGLYLLQQYTPKHAYDICKMLNRCSHKVIYVFIALLKKDTPQLENIRTTLSNRDIWFNI